MNHIIVADKKSNFIATVVTPATCSVVPAIGGFILANSHDPFFSLLCFLAVIISGLVFHLMALDWRDTKLSNTALCAALSERDKEIEKLKWELE